MDAEKTIIKKAIDLIWQNPKRDHSTTLELTRITPINGYNDYGNVGYELVECPLAKGRFHFYQIGGNEPYQLTLIPKKNQWYRLDEWCHVVNLVIHAFNKVGRLIPLSQCYTIRLNNNIILIGIEINDKIVRLNDEKVYLHFYRNHYYQDDSRINAKDHINYVSFKETKHTHISEAVDFVRLLNPVVHGKHRLTYNGYLTDSIQTVGNERGDTLELHFDLSILKVVDIPVSQLRTYKSRLDKKNKYLIHLPKDDNDFTIHYRDDVDFFVYRKKDNKVKGLYYHRNQEDAVRMVTHQDYGLPVPYVMSYIEALDDNPNLDEFYIRVYVRDNGLNKTLVDDVNMIRSLYFLDDDQIVEAMVAVDSTIPEWTASHLEESAYVAVMRSFYHEIDFGLAYNAFSYSALINEVANPNIIVQEDENGRFFPLGEGLQTGVITVFEYDIHGLLLGYYHHKDYPRYFSRHPETVFIEAYAGEGGEQLNQHIGRDKFKLQKETAYRFYLAKTSLGEIVSDFKEATGDKRILIEPDGYCTFNHKEIGELGIAWADDKFLCYDLYNTVDDGVIDFTLTQAKNNPTPLYIPPGKLDLWLNGHALVEGIDYLVRFPLVTIINKEYLDDVQPLQRITVRMMGYPVDDNGVLKRIAPRETGFVKHGRISVNQRYDLHEGRLMRTVVQGGTFHPIALTFDEDQTIDVSEYFNDGSPYSIETPYISVKGTLGVNLYEKATIDYRLTQRISDYLSLHHRHPRQYNEIVTIPRRYKVYSPFLSRIISDIRYGYFRSPLPKTTNKIIDKMLEPYKKFLTVDPALQGYDSQFVELHAHCFLYYVNLNARDIAFLERVNKLYLNDNVDISHFLRVKK